MSWTYGGDPAGSLRDRVRFLVGDTEAAQPLASDGEVDWSLARHGSPAAAAAALARALAARFARQVDLSIGDLSRAAAQQHAHFLALAERLAREAASEGVGLHAGALDPVRGGFRLGQHDFTEGR